MKLFPLHILEAIVYTKPCLQINVSQSKMHLVANFVRNVQNATRLSSNHAFAYVNIASNSSDFETSASITPHLALCKRPVLALCRAPADGSCNHAKGIRN